MCSFFKPTILLVDDEERFVTMLAKRMAMRGYDCDVAHDGESALERFTDHSYKLVILDLRLPGLSGKDVLERIKMKHPEIPVVILTGHGNEIDKAECLELKAHAFLQKPVNIAQLISIYDELNGPLPGTGPEGAGQ